MHTQPLHPARKILKENHGDEAIRSLGMENRAYYFRDSPQAADRQEFHERLWKIQPDRKVDHPSASGFRADGEVRFDHLPFWVFCSVGESRTPTETRRSGMFWLHLHVSIILGIRKSDTSNPPWVSPSPRRVLKNLEWNLNDLYFGPPTTPDMAQLPIKAGVS